MSTQTSPTERARAADAGFSRLKVYSSREARAGARRQLAAVGFTYFVEWKDVNGLGLLWGHAPDHWPDTCPVGQRWSQPGNTSVVEYEARRARGAA